MKDSHRLKSFQHVEKLALAGYDLADWYSVAEQDILAICRLENWGVEKFTSILSILSPRVSIRRNVRSALVYFGQDSQFFKNTLPNVKRSLEIYLASGIIGGNKVPHFCRALLGDTESITLDTWMANALLDVDTPHIKHFMRRNTHKRADSLVTRVGKKLGLSPRDTQAAIWCGCFRETGLSPQYFPIVDEYKNWLSQDKNFPLIGTIADYQDEISFDTSTFTQEVF